MKKNNCADIKIDLSSDMLQKIDDICNELKITRDAFFEKVIKDYIIKQEEK